MANNYGWVVESRDAHKAYDFACEHFDIDDLNSQIVQSLSSDELAESLAYIFRMHDFREWEQFNKNNI